MPVLASLKARRTFKPFWAVYNLAHYRERATQRKAVQGAVWKRVGLAVPPHRSLS